MPFDRGYRSFASRIEKAVKGKTPVAASYIPARRATLAEAATTEYERRVPGRGARGA
jgi:hypothetical protein